jgi:translation elongation factor EF-4
MKSLKKFVESPYVNIIIGLILLLSGLNEAWDTLSEDIMNGNFGSRHGVIIFGFFHVLKSISEIFKGFEYMTKK